jgi:hypothetical protein
MSALYGIREASRGFRYDIIEDPRTADERYPVMSRGSHTEHPDRKSDRSAMGGAVRYLVASGVWCLVVLAALAHHWWVESMVSGMMEQAKIKAGLPPGSPVNDLGIPVTGQHMFQIKLDHMVVNLCSILLPAVLALCLGIAASLPRAGPAEPVPSSSSSKP